ncbi:MAG: alpha amylase C-terminal domain-containing protein, partial [Clostridia bacterium]|nr:alpha amylase C-terminal domain-containing protein [Clostridia bacterium]
KLTFMGQEFAHFSEWDEKKQLDWMLLDYDSHRMMQEFSKKLNALYLASSPLWQVDYSWEGFSWLISDDSTNSVIALTRTNDKGEIIAVVCNFTPVDRPDYRIGFPFAGKLKLIFNSDAAGFGGRDRPVKKSVKIEKVPSNGSERSFVLDLPGLTTLYYSFTREKSNFEKQLARTKRKNVVTAKKGMKNGDKQD